MGGPAVSAGTVGELTRALKEALPGLDGLSMDRFGRYYALLVEYNARVNLTAITDPVEVAEKHFADSLLPASLIPEGATVIDVGTGAGFPGVPLLIARPDIELTLLDSLNKRLVFLEALLQELGLHAAIVHARAEDGGRDPGLRARFDIAVSRAVAHTAELAELTIPYLKVGGASLMYKAAKAADELGEAHSAMEKLGAKARLVRYNAPWGERFVIVAQKELPTAPAYPRTAVAMGKKRL